MLLLQNGKFPLVLSLRDQECTGVELSHMTWIQVINLTLDFILQSQKDFNLTLTHDFT